jgi:hypothetical protein
LGAIPEPGANESVIAVGAAGLRALDTGGAQPLAGVALRLYDGSGSAPGAAVAEAWGSCVSDQDGNCAFTVPDTGEGGANRDRRFWIRQAAAPAGYRVVDNLVTSADGTTFEETRYQSRTGTQLRGGQTYLSSASFMAGARGVYRSSGVWPSIRDNPPFPAACGLSVALVLDLSWSVEESGAEPTLKDFPSSAATRSRSWMPWGIEEIPSRYTVPPEASSRIPGRSAAPV